MPGGAHGPHEPDRSIGRPCIGLLSGNLSRRYRSSGGIVRMSSENLAWATGSTGRYLTLVLAGSMPRKLSPFQFREGLIGLGTNPPPQFGTHVAERFDARRAERAFIRTNASVDRIGRQRLVAVLAGRTKFQHRAPSLNDSRTARADAAYTEPQRSCVCDSGTRTSASNPCVCHIYALTALRRRARW